MFYTTTNTYEPELMNNIHMEMYKKCISCNYYVESAIFNTNIEQWKLTVENPTFVKVIPDQEELTMGTVYILRYVGD